MLVAALLPFSASLGVGALSKAGQRHLLTGGIGTDRAFKRDRHQYASLGNDGGRVKNERPSNERAFTIRDFAGSQHSADAVSALIARVDGRCGSPAASALDSSSSSGDGLGTLLVVEHDTSGCLVGCAAWRVVRRSKVDEAENRAVLAVAHGVRVDAFAMAALLGDGPEAGGVVVRVVPASVSSGSSSGGGNLARSSSSNNNNNNNNNSSSSSSRGDGWTRLPPGRLLEALVEEVANRASAAGARNVATLAFPPPELSFVR